MFSKPVRIGLLIVGLVVTAALGYRAVDDETSLGRAYHDNHTHRRAASQALEAVLDLRASLHAYVAPGQGVPFWSRRAQQSIDSLREHLATLDWSLAPHSKSMADALDTVDQLAAAERRARDFARRGETLLAGDVVFTETRDLISALTAHLHDTRNLLDAAYDQRMSSLRREQAILALGALVMWALVAAAFAIPSKPVVEKKPEEWRQELATAIKKPIPKDPSLATTPPPPPPVVVQQVVPMGPTVPTSAVNEVAEICSDLSTLSDIGALSGALGRVAGLLDATGVIVWLATNDGAALAPVASHGFDQKLVSRIGRIPRDSANLTAAAFRENVARVSEPTATAPAALAVALCSPSGTVGVLSVELKSNVAADEGRVALATIFAAQLATLAAPLPSVVPADAPDEPLVPVAPAKTAAL
jgi:hypothetical protein